MADGKGNEREKGAYIALRVIENKFCVEVAYIYYIHWSPSRSTSIKLIMKRIRSLHLRFTKPLTNQK